MPDYYRIHVSLLDVMPKSWRGFLIAKDATFMDLYEAIQDACGRRPAEFSVVEPKRWFDK